MNKQHLYIRLTLLLALVILTMQGCRPKRDITPLPEPIPELVPREVIANMHGRQAAFDFFSARFSGTASLNGDRYNISGSLRIRKDSAIYISVTPVFGIELARMVITPDTLRLLNRLESTYFEGEMQQLDRFYDTGLDFHMLQALLVGNDFTRNRLFEASNDRNMIRLYTEGKAGSHTAARLTQAMWLDQITFRPMQAMAYDPEKSRSIQIQYPGYLPVDGELLPAIVKMVFSDPKTKMELELNYSRTSINQPQQISFSIPAHYKPIVF